MATGVKSVMNLPIRSLLCDVNHMTSLLQECFIAIARYIIEDESPTQTC